MWIRNQWRTDLVKIDYLFIDEDDENFILGYHRDKVVELGLYSTKERAFEVLDEIQTKISSGYTICIMPEK
jgi:hypothetical protein